jgi:hypothetical protein
MADGSPPSLTPGGIGQFLSLYQSFSRQRRSERQPRKCRFALPIPPSFTPREARRRGGGRPEAAAFALDDATRAVLAVKLAEAGTAFE